MKVLSRAASVVQRACGPRLKTRLIPQLEFEYDPSVEGAIRMSQLIAEARGSDPDGGTGEGAVDGAGEENTASGAEVKDDRVESAERDDGGEDGVEEDAAGVKREGRGPGE